MLKNLRIAVTDMISCLIKKSDSIPKRKPQINRLKYGALPSNPDLVKSNFRTYLKWNRCFEKSLFFSFKLNSSLLHSSISVLQPKRNKMTINARNGEKRGPRMVPILRCVLSVAFLSKIENKL